MPHRLHTCGYNHLTPLLTIQYHIHLLTIQYHVLLLTVNHTPAFPVTVLHALAYRRILFNATLVPLTLPDRATAWRSGIRVGQRTRCRHETQERGLHFGAAGRGHNLSLVDYRIVVIHQKVIRNVLVHVITICILKLLHENVIVHLAVRNRVHRGVLSRRKQRSIHLRKRNASQDTEQRRIS